MVDGPIGFDLRVRFKKFLEDSYKTLYPIIFLYITNLIKKNQFSLLIFFKILL